MSDMYIYTLRLLRLRGQHKKRKKNPTALPSWKDRCWGHEPARSTPFSERRAIFHSEPPLQVELVDGKIFSPLRRRQMQACVSFMQSPAELILCLRKGKGPARGCAGSRSHFSKPPAGSNETDAGIITAPGCVPAAASFATASRTPQCPS